MSKKSETILASIADRNGELHDVTQLEVDTAISKFYQGVPVSALSPKELLILGSKLGKRAVELPDPTPLAPPLGYVEQVPIHLQIRDMIRGERLRQAAEEAGAETFDEADDFELEDEEDYNTPYEAEYEPFQVVKDRAKDAADKEALRKAAEAAKSSKSPPEGGPAGGRQTGPEGPSEAS